MPVAGANLVEVADDAFGNGNWASSGDEITNAAVAVLCY